MPTFPGNPSVQVTENNLTGVVPSVGTTTGAFVGAFRWGPANVRVQITNEAQLRSTFLTPDSNTYLSFFSAANFLAYGNDLRVGRAVGPNANNATASTTGVQIQNESIWDAVYFPLGTAAYGPFVARYPGAEGNSLLVSVCPGANSWNKVLVGTANTTANANTIVFSSNQSGLIAAGDILSVGNTGYVQGNVILSTLLANGLMGYANTNWGATVLQNTATASWAYSSYFAGPPGTSPYATSVNGANDQMHVIVVDAGGVFSTPPVGNGGANTPLQVFAYASKAVDAVNNDGSGNYIRDIIRNQSPYVYWMENLVGGTNWGNTAAGTTFTTLGTNYYQQLSGGQTDTPGDAALESVWSSLFTDPDVVNVGLLIGGSTSQALANYLISNVAEVYQYAVLFLSPRLNDVVNVPGQEITNITTYTSTLPASTRTFIDANWKYMLDRYNNVYRWVPCNADVAGCCVRTDTQQNAWWSPAGLNRGSIKNATKLAWNPNASQQAILYPMGINPIVNMIGAGPILYGDRTFTVQPTAFNRINVRRLFIVLEQSLRAAAKYSLFEFNDEFTRANFVSIVTPFLQNVQGLRGITAFNVVCDATNNTPQVIQNNQFVGTIQVMPNYSINWIQLNFVAVNSTATFTTVPVSF